jgi:two-component SAPR family response regulator
VTLADGWVGTALAATILAAVAAAWALRRHRYRPRTPTSPRNPDPWWPPTPHIVGRLLASRRHHDEPDDEPLDGALAAVTGPAPHVPVPAARELPLGGAAEALRHRLDHDIQLDAPEPVGDPAPARSVTHQPATATGPELSGIGPLPTTGLFLTGPGAPAAARALITAALVTTGRQQGHIITDRTTANALFDREDLHHHRLTVADTTAGAVEHITREILAHARETQDHDQPTPSPATILLLDSAAGHHKVIDALLPVAAADNIGAVLLNPHRPADGDTITVDTDGHSDLGRRLAVLDTTSALDLLELLNPEPAARQEPNQPAIITEPEPAVSAPATDTTKIQVRILGRPQILDHHGQPVTGLRTAAIQTLVLLAVRRTHIAKIDLWEALFPEATMQRAEERFAVTIADLRNGFRRAGGDTTLNAVPNPGGRYRLDPDLVDVDLWRFDDHLAAVSRTTDPETRRDHLRRAIALHAGPLADGTSYDWTEPIQHAHTSRVIDALVALAESAHDPSEASELLAQACQLAPGNTAVFHLALRAFRQARDLDRTRAAIERHLAALSELDIGLNPEAERLIEAARNLGAVEPVGEGRS